MLNRASSFATAIELYDQRLAIPHVAAIRNEILTALGMPTNNVYVMAGGQPLLVGGTPKVLGKLLLLRFMRQLIPNCRTVYLFCSNDETRCNREFYRTLLPIGMSDKWMGLSCNYGHKSGRASQTFVPPEHVTRLYSDLSHFFSPMPLPDVLDDPDACRTGDCLSALNQRRLQLLAGLLDLEPDYWLVDLQIEDQIARTALFNHIIQMWPAFLDRYNACVAEVEKPLAVGLAPFWVCSRGPGRIRVNQQDDRFTFDGKTIHVRELQNKVVSEELKILLRATPRVLALSRVFQGQVTGSGSTYNIVLERAATNLGIDVMPRFALAAHVVGYGHRPRSGSRQQNDYGVADLFRLHSVTQVKDAIQAALRGSDIIISSVNPIIELEPITE